MAARKLWRTVWRSVDAETVHRVDQHESRAAAYRYVENDAANYAAVPSPSRQVTLVFVDERDGLGWQLYELVDLADYGKES